MDLQQVRRDTPATSELLHFNNAGAALMPQAVLEAQLSYLRHEARWGGYRTAREQAPQLEAFYQEAATFLNAQPHEIAFAGSATEAWLAAFGALRFEAGDRILSCQAEYGSNFLAFLQRKKREGVHIEVIPDDPSGQIDLQALESMIDERVKLISLTHIPSNGGLVNPAGEVGKLARRYDIPFLLDACQSAGQYPLDVARLGCDFLSATGRKYLRGPRGSGLLYVRETWLERLEPEWIDIFGGEWLGPEQYRFRKDARRFEHFERNFAGQAGLGVALAYVNRLGQQAAWERLRELGRSLRAELSGIPGIEVKDKGKLKGGIVTFEIVGQDPAAHMASLAAENINVSVTPPNSTLLDALDRNLPPLMRASVHYYNTQEEIGHFCQRIRELTLGPGIA
jgi:cysteine desulfurase/selenocysteine lyase